MSRYIYFVYTVYNMRSFVPIIPGHNTCHYSCDIQAFHIRLQQHRCCTFPLYIASRHPINAHKSLQYQPHYSPIVSTLISNAKYMVACIKLMMIFSLCCNSFWTWFWSSLWKSSIDKSEIICSYFVGHFFSFLIMVSFLLCDASNRFHVPRSSNS